MSEFENFRLPLHFARAHESAGDGRAADQRLAQIHSGPMGPDSAGRCYAMDVDADRQMHELLRSAGYLDLFTALAVDDYLVAAEILRHGSRRRLARGGILHLMAKRGHVVAVKWLLANGADPNAIWAHWDADVTALHLAVLGNHPDTVARVAGRRRRSRHQGQQARQRRDWLGRIFRPKRSCRIADPLSWGQAAILSEMLSSGKAGILNAPDLEDLDRRRQPLRFGVGRSRSADEGAAWILRTTSMPDTTRPNAAKPWPSGLRAPPKSSDG